MSSQSQSLTALRKLSQQLQADNQKVSRWATQLLSQIDGLSQAAADNDWSTVHRISETLYRFGRQRDIGELSDQAQAVNQALKAPHHLTELKRQVIKLIGVCGRLPEKLPAGG